MIDRLPASHRLDHADRNAEDDRDQKRRPGKGEGVRETVGDSRGDRLIREERRPEVAVERAREPLDVTLRHGPVKTHEPYEGLALLRRHIEPHDRGRTAGSEVHEEEREGAREDDHERPQRDALKKEASYCRSGQAAPDSRSEAEVTS